MGDRPDPPTRMFPTRRDAHRSDEWTEFAARRFALARLGARYHGKGFVKVAIPRSDDRSI